MLKKNLVKVDGDIEFLITRELSLAELGIVDSIVFPMATRSEINYTKKHTAFDLNKLKLDVAGQICHCASKGKGKQVLPYPFTHHFSYFEFDNSVGFAMTCNCACLEPVSYVDLECLRACAPRLFLRWNLDYCDNLLLISLKENHVCFYIEPPITICRVIWDKSWVRIRIVFYVFWNKASESTCSEEVTRVSSESVTEGRPNMLYDQILDVVLGLLQDPDSMIAWKTCFKTIMVMKYGVFSNRASLASEKIGFGHATDETPELLPLRFVLATKLGLLLSEVRKNVTCVWLVPDGKTQVTVVYQNDQGAMVVHTIPFSTHHDENVTNVEIVVDPKEYVFMIVVLEKSETRRCSFRVMWVFLCGWSLSEDVGNKMRCIIVFELLHWKEGGSNLWRSRCIALMSVNVLRFGFVPILIFSHASATTFQTLSRINFLRLTALDKEAAVESIMDVADDVVVEGITHKLEVRDRGE
ncbi:hypothetical protein POM88_042083 [Heracleum sosnowskyi]|uniref:S-adenosylmethionine synthetase central domain-containing protein n=1 Tax=Heracleum sosnowskyi TaxID=360622 RepID=A0AAD8HI08_9APIA|nr:hypothetical protein POM88_042083 [Heracleum sosnowskyi]